MQCSNYINVNNYCNNTGHDYIQGLVLDKQGYQPVIFKKTSNSNSYVVLNSQENYGVFSLSGSVYGSGCNCMGCGSTSLREAGHPMSNCGCNCKQNGQCKCPYLKGVS